MNLDERQALRAFFNSPLWKKAWNNALEGAPNLLPPGLDSALGGVVANNRLHQLQGWELFKLALARQIEDRQVRPPRPLENYPEDLEIVKAPKKP